MVCVARPYCAARDAAKESDEAIAARLAGGPGVACGLAPALVLLFGLMVCKPF
jgi:hypothetical protein